ncbi:anaerobic dehydrogenase [Rothia mucilaginosa DY-18]|uniref:Anaerobic dehydrogenase n=1 Tax=Rothia mucilaginosa (strain DY-18) TaxID=680646 RepID=D2NR14_ROTMD|nr:anaerobic dehydrogenase [Rothia mucilaginosa DY-18]
MFAAFWRIWRVVYCAAGIFKSPGVPACLWVSLRIALYPDPLADEHGGVSLLGVCVVHACAGECLVDLGDGCFDLALGCVPLVQHALEVSGCRAGPGALQIVQGCGHTVDVCGDGCDVGSCLCALGCDDFGIDIELCHGFLL